MSEPRFPDVTVRLVGEDRNAFAILGRVNDALHKAGHGAQVAAFNNEATAGGYDHLLATCMAWVNVE